MPVININCNKLSIEKKRKLVKSITEIASSIMELPESTITILINEIEHENVGSGGLLLSDRDNNTKPD